MGGGPPTVLLCPEKLGYGYTDVAQWLEWTGRPRPSAMQRATREMLLNWLSDEDNRFKFDNDLERLLKGEESDGEA